MKSDYAFIVCADIRYLPEVVGLLNSLDYVGNTSDVHFWGYKIPQETQEQFILLNYQVIFHEITDQEIQESHGLSEVVCRKRYYFANEIGQDYKAICVLDADMIFCRNPILYFEVAEKTGLILGVVKEQKESYKDPHHKFKNEWIMPEGFIPEFDLCNCPLFVDTKIWGEALRRSYEIFIDGFNEMKGDNFKGADMAAMNLMLAKYGSEGKTIPLPNIQWLSTNEQALKLYQRAVTDYDKIKTETGTPIYSYHGQYYHPRWRNVQLMNRNHCAQGYFKASGESLQSSNNIARGAMELLYGRFKKMLDWKIIIEKKNYRHPEKNYGFLDVVGEEDFLK